MVSKPNSRTHTKAPPQILAYRDPSNKLQYALNPNPTPNAPSNPSSPAFPNQLVPPSSEQVYDSDAEPLITKAGEELDPEDLQRFTATGKPMPVYRHSAYANMHDMYTVPQLLPKRYTDDSVIPAIVTGVLAGEGPTPASPEPAIPGGKRRASVPGGEKKERKGIFGMLRRKSRDEGGKGLTRVVYMPRRDYLKFFAKDLKGDYVGSEPFRVWSEGELERQFGKYKPEVPVKTGYRVPT